MGARVLQYLVVLAITLVIWQIASSFTIPLFLPSPARVGSAAVSMFDDGTLVGDIGITYVRVIAGWLIGAALAVPLGILTSRLRLVRLFVQPYVDFFRFIPPIAFISIAIIWLGVGEAGKISLIVYASFFTVFMNTLAGGTSVDIEKIRAAQALGASHSRVLYSVVVPATVPAIITGLQVAMGISFMTVVAAELVAADAGVGFQIWNARVFGQTDVAFVGIITLGLMGFSADGVLRLIIKRFFRRYV